jgi:hypothetical protein
MTSGTRREAPWLGRSDVEKLLFEVAPQGGERRLRLFACACCRLAWPLLAPPAQQTVEMFEGLADGVAISREVPTRFRVQADTGSAGVWAVEAVEGLRGWFSHPFDAAGIAAHGLRWQMQPQAGFRGPLDSAAAVPAHAARAARDAVGEWAWTRARALEVALVADIYGTAFHGPWTVRPEWLRWNDGCLVKMAQVLYDSHRFEEMPILADALEEAGCEDAHVLDHCRSHPRHARGCWVVDALLRREPDKA